MTPLLLLSAVLAADPKTPEEKAIAFLSKEVPAWSGENKCFSCHNNGDGARALYRAARLNYPLPPKALDDTSRWLPQTARWDETGGGSQFNDRTLLRIQFANALAEGIEAGLIKDRDALVKAASQVAERQSKDGSWQVDADAVVGSPATYGTPLATYTASRFLHKVDEKKYAAAVKRADSWLRKLPVKTVMDAAVLLLTLEGDGGREAAATRKECLALLAKAQSKDGGWGPRVQSSPEVFDTALVVLTLLRYRDEAGVKDRIKAGRGYLLAEQKEDGSWPETTRPSGAVSYAQRLSTAGWATTALLATR